MIPVPVVANEVCGSGSLCSMAAALEDATPIARITATEESISAVQDACRKY